MPFLLSCSFALCTRTLTCTHSVLFCFCFFPHVSCCFKTYTPTANDSLLHLFLSLTNERIGFFSVRTHSLISILLFLRKRIARRKTNKVIHQFLFFLENTIKHRSFNGGKDKKGREFVVDPFFLLLFIVAFPVERCLSRCHWRSGLRQKARRECKIRL